MREPGGKASQLTLQEKCGGKMVRGRTEVEVVESKRLGSRELDKERLGTGNEQRRDRKAPPGPA